MTMSQLTEVYNCINGAEKQMRKGDLSEALTLYRQAIQFLNGLECQGVSAEIFHAVGLLRQDIDSRIKELECLLEQRKPAMSKNGTLTNSAVSLAKTRSWDNSRSLSSGVGPPSDPFLASIMGKLQVNLVDAVCNQLKEEDSRVVKELDNRIAQQLARFKKELTLYEQKKSKDYNARLEQAISENKKLSNQILKLRGRWDSLVESAKQRRSRQHED